MHRATLMLLVVLAPSLAAADKFQDKLDRGEILCYPVEVKGSDAPRMVVKAVINAPPARVWKLIDACGRYKGTIPRIAASKEVSREKTARGERVLCRVTIDMPFPYSDKTSLTEAFHTVSKTRWVRRWTLIKGDYKVNTGSWVLTPFKGDPNRTYVHYRVHAVPDAWVPGWVKNMAQKRSLPKMIRRLRKLSGAR